jgi:hypothetical protein
MSRLSERTDRHRKFRWCLGCNETRRSSSPCLTDMSLPRLALLLLQGNRTPLSPDLWFAQMSHKPKEVARTASDGPEVESDPLEPAQQLGFALGILG